MIPQRSPLLFSGQDITEINKDHLTSTGSFQGILKQKKKKNII
jgi:hypothetical protein